MNNRDFLEHYGVLGMKWRKHKAQRIEKKSERQFKKATDRSVDNLVKANNYAADRINGKWLDDFNKKWEPRFKDVDDWQTSPHWKPYIKAYSDNLVKLMNEKPTKVQLANGKTFVQEFLSKNNDAAISWEWKETK